MSAGPGRHWLLSAGTGGNVAGAGGMPDGGMGGEGGTFDDGGMGGEFNAGAAGK